MGLHRPAALAAFLATAALAGAAAGCGADGSGADGSGAGGEVVVSAATSLKAAFTSYGEKFAEAEAQFSFAGSDELAAQIRSGAKPDVFASANTTLPDELFKEGLVERPQAFATNRLVLAVPAENAKVESLDDLTSKGTAIVMGAAAVPIGAYTRKLLDRLDERTEAAILANVRSNEPDVGGISAKLAQGAADAGFLYLTDVVATNGRLKSIALPPASTPEVAYAVAIVKGAEHRAQAQAFVAGLLDGIGAGTLKRAGFRPPPAQ